MLFFHGAIIEISLERHVHNESVDSFTLILPLIASKPKTSYSEGSRQPEDTWHWDPVAASAFHYVVVANGGTDGKDPPLLPGHIPPSCTCKAP